MESEQICWLKEFFGGVFKSWVSGPRTEAVHFTDCVIYDQIDLTWHFLRKQVTLWQQNKMTSNLEQEKDKKQKEMWSKTLVRRHKMNLSPVFHA